MDKTLRVPIGWKRGEPLVVSRVAGHGEMAWMVEPVSSSDSNKDVPLDAIACQWFHEWSKFERFIKWWNNDLS